MVALTVVFNMNDANDPPHLIDPDLTCLPSRPL